LPAKAINHSSAEGMDSLRPFLFALRPFLFALRLAALRACAFCLLFVSFAMISTLPGPPIGPLSSCARDHFRRRFFLREAFRIFRFFFLDRPPPLRLRSEVTWGSATGAGAFFSDSKQAHHSMVS